MKFLFDLFPVILFFIAYKMYDIFVATGVAIGASALQVLLFWLKHRRFERMHVITFGLLVVLGGATILFQDEAFIKWKVSVVNWVFGLVFIGSFWIGKKTLAERMMGKAVSLPDFVWRHLNWGWGGFFIGVGVLNLYVAYFFDTDTWVNFKLFGVMGLTLLFVLAQAVYLSRHVKEEPEETNENTKH